MKRIDAFDYTEWSYKTYLDGKSVVLVGGSLDAWIPTREDGFDIIVRVNSHVQRQGGECDVLYHTCVPGLKADLIDSLIYPSFVFLNLVDGNYTAGQVRHPQYLDFLCELRAKCPGTDVGYFAQGEWQNQNPFGRQYEWLNELHKKYQTNFFTGLVALAHILRANPSGVYVCGMNMYVQRTKGSVDSQVDNHQIKGNLQFLKDAMKDSRVCFDKELRESLHAYGVI